MNELIAIGSQLAGDKRTVSGVQSDERVLTALGCVYMCVGGGILLLYALSKGEGKKSFLIRYVLKRIPLLEAHCLGGKRRER